MTENCPHLCALVKKNLKKLKTKTEGGDCSSLQMEAKSREHKVHLHHSGKVLCRCEKLNAVNKECFHGRINYLFPLVNKNVVNKKRHLNQMTVKCKTPFAHTCSVSMYSFGGLFQTSES